MGPRITTAATTVSTVKSSTARSLAYVTFLAGNGDYVKGVVGLAKGLRKVKSKYPLVVAVLPDVPEEHRQILVSQGCIVREIEPVHPPENQTQYAMAYYVINYSKLRIWEFVEYSKMIYLDGDIQVFENIDHLFDYPDNYFYAVKDCFCEPNWRDSPQFKIRYCQQCPDKVQWDNSLGPRPPLYFNAGMFVYQPCLSTYQELLSTLKTSTPTLFAEQDFLNNFFKDKYKPIPSDYNLVLAMLWRHPENIQLDKVKVVHYCANGSKPWRYNGEGENMEREDIKMLVKRWWDIYIGVVRVVSMSRTKRHRDYPPASSPCRNPNQPEPEPEPAKKHHQSDPTFPSYLDTPNPLPPKIKLLCAIVAEIHGLSVEETLNDTGIRVTQQDVEEVLKLSYAFPGPAFKFFQWSGRQLNEGHSPYSWNLVVDLLGKNCLFDPMWDAIKSMKQERLLSLATFASVFSSYVVAHRTPEALMTFEVMDQYGVPTDIVALNSLLSAICRDGKTTDALDFYYIAKDKIRPDPDTYAILLEGWESEGNVASATKVLDEMVSHIGWDPTNVPAYDSYLNTLLNGPNGIREALDFFETLKAKRCYPGVKFFRLALDECVKKGDPRGAEALWEAMVGRLGLQPDTNMYNLMISLHCHGNNINVAKRMLDEMVYNGTFPNSQTYNMLFKMLIKNRKLQEAAVLFTEMIKNECVLDQDNCIAAVRIYLDLGDPYFAIKVWKFMIENYRSGLEDTGNLLVLGLRNLNRVPEAVKYAEDMMLRGIKLSSSSMSKLKDSLVQAKKQYMYDELLRKSKAQQLG